MSDENRGWEFFAGFLLGSFVGAAAALLFAPQSGEETREEIRERGIELQGRMNVTTEEARQRAEQLALQARQRAAEAQERGRMAMEEQRSRLQDAIEQGREAANRKRDEMTERLNAERAKGEGEPTA
jgi:gas vesicle protein